MKVEDESLASLLSTPALRLEFALFVALCTDEMRRHVLSNFPEPDAETAPASAVASPPLALLDGDLIDSTEEETDQSIAAEDRRRRRNQDLASPQLQGMKRAAAVLPRRTEYNAKAETKVKGCKDQNATVPRHGNGLGTIPIIPTSLAQLEETKKRKILLCLLLLTLSLERYTAQSRALLQIVTASLHIPPSTLSDLESTVSHGLLATAANMSADESTKKEAADNAVGRRWKVGLATVAGAALIGVTGGLAAPFLAAGIGTVMGGLGLSIPLIGGYLGAMAGSSILIGGLFGSYGGRMTGKMMEKYAKEVEDFSFISVNQTQSRKGDTEAVQGLGEAEQSQHKLRVAVCISGWLVDESDITAPWQVFRGSAIEPFALRWEVSSLRDLGVSILKVLKSHAWSAAKLELVRRTIFASLFAGLWPLGLLRIAPVLDNPYSVAKARSDKTGRVLPQALIQKVQGERPVTLVGLSLGARVIYQALIVLGEQNAFGLVESVVLIGAPVPSEERAWRKSEQSRREEYLQQGVAGLQTVEDVDRVENYDATRLMDGKGHASYRYIVGLILREIGFEDIDTVVVKREEGLTREIGIEPAMGDLIPTDGLLASTEQTERDWPAVVDENAEKGRNIPKDVTKKASDHSKTTLIETAERERPLTPETDDEESDDELDQRIAMLDLDPEPIL